MESDEETPINETEVQFANLEELNDYEQSSLTGSNKGKYYKQTYRTAWEQMPDFKGWLRGIPGEPTRAFCMYCQKSLHAHRLSLLKHTCTIRHQKAAQLNHSRQKGNNSDTNDSTMESLSYIVEAAGSSGQEEGEIETYDTIVEAECELEGEEEEEEDEEEGEGDGHLEVMPVQAQKQVRAQPRIVMASKPVISTHVLDISKGVAVSGLQVSLYKLIDGRWTYINEGLTNPEGRFSNFLAREDFTAGRYKLHFDVDRYFEMRKQETLYPFIEIVFDCRAPIDHYHIPLLLGPFGYTTYRGT